MVAHAAYGTTSPPGYAAGDNYRQCRMNPNGTNQFWDRYHLQRDEWAVMDFEKSWFVVELNTFTGASR